jgi:hypothetical protein
VRSQVIGTCSQRVLPQRSIIWTSDFCCSRPLKALLFAFKMTQGPDRLLVEVAAGDAEVFGGDECFGNCACQLCSRTGGDRRDVEDSAGGRYVENLLTSSFVGAASVRKKACPSRTSLKLYASHADLFAATCRAYRT